MKEDVNVARRFPVNRIGRHGDTRQIILKDSSRCSLCVTHIVISVPDTLSVEKKIESLFLSFLFLTLENGDVVFIRRGIGTESTQTMLFQ
jgi:hypothetical protein